MDKETEVNYSKICSRDIVRVPATTKNWKKALSKRDNMGSGLAS